MKQSRYFVVKLQYIFNGKTNYTFYQLFRYTFVGGLAFIIDFGTLIFLKEFFHIYYLVAAAIAFILGLTLNYFLSIIWVFNTRVVKNSLIEFFIFSLIGFVGISLNIFFLWLFTDIFSVYYLISKLIATIIIFFWNFFMRKILLF